MKEEYVPKGHYLTELSRSSHLGFSSLGRIQKVMSVSSDQLEYDGSQVLICYFTDNGGFKVQIRFSYDETLFQSDITEGADVCGIFDYIEITRHQLAKQPNFKAMTRFTNLSPEKFAEIIYEHSPTQYPKLKRV